MQKNKLLILGLLAVFTVLIAGTASAFDFSFLTGGDEAQEVTIEGVQFNIPSGYEEDEDYAYDNETVDSGGLTYTMNGKTYENEDGDVIVIVIANYGKYNVTDDIISEVADEPKTINDVDGYVTVDDNITLFAYEKNNDLVTVTVTDDSLLDQIIIG